MMQVRLGHKGVGGLRSRGATQRIKLDPGLRAPVPCPGFGHKVFPSENSLT